MQYLLIFILIVYIFVFRYFVGLNLQRRSICRFCGAYVSILKYQRFLTVKTFNIPKFDISNFDIWHFKTSIHSSILIYRKSTVNYYKTLATISTLQASNVTIEIINARNTTYHMVGKIYLHFCVLCICLFICVTNMWF